MGAPPNKTVYWRHRRRMAYVALSGLVGIGLAALCVSVTEPQATLLQAVAYMLGLIVGSYLGAATWDDIKDKVP